MTKPILTIAIPTYNRAPQLLRTVEILLPQLNNQVIFKIFDNCSDLIVEKYIKDEIETFEKINFYRNEINLGVCGNIIKCIENCSTEWLWILGDDDPPFESAVETILNTLDSDYSFINFASHLSNRSTCKESIGENDFIDSVDDFGNLLYISVGCYNVNRLKKGLRFAYQFSYSLAPHLCYLFGGIDFNSKILFSNKKIIDVDKYDTPLDKIWNWIPLSTSIITLNEIPLNLNNENRLKLFNFTKTHCILFRNKNQFQKELLSLKGNLLDSQIMYYYDQINLRWSLNNYSNSFINRIIYFLNYSISRYKFFTKLSSFSKKNDFDLFNRF